MVIYLESKHSLYEEFELILVESLDDIVVTLLRTAMCLIGKIPYKCRPECFHDRQQLGFGKLQTVSERHYMEHFS